MAKTKDVSKTAIAAATLASYFAEHKSDKAGKEAVQALTDETGNRRQRRMMRSKKGRANADT